MEAPAHAPKSPPTSPLHALLREWFVEYNPVYLFSAALVLGGLTLVSCDLAEEGALAYFGVTAVAELYALALIGGAALLVRIGSRRVGIMVGLLAALYQCDLTMHVETSAFLDGVGWVAAFVWIALFVVKLRLLARALELRLSRSAMLVPSLGAAGLALLPQVFRHVLPADRSTLVALFVFAVGAAALWTARSVESAVGFDYRGRRAVRGTWIMWAAGALLHVAYWSDGLGAELWASVPAALLWTTRWARTERAVWLTSLLALLAVAPFGVEHVSSTALMISVVLALRALRSPVAPRPAIPAVLPPYRGARLEPTADPAAAAEPSFGRADPIAIERLLLGAAASVHLSLWTMGANGDAWPAHQPLLDLALFVPCALVMWKSRRWQSLVPVAPTATHLAISLGWLTMPRGAAQWGASSVALGFALLGGALAASWRAHHRRGLEPPAASRERDSENRDRPFSDSAPAS